MILRYSLTAAFILNAALKGGYLTPSRADLPGSALFIANFRFQARHQNDQPRILHSTAGIVWQTAKDNNKLPQRQTKSPLPKDLIRGDEP